MIKDNSNNNPKQIGDGYSSVIEPNVSEDKTNEDEDYSFLNLIHNDESNNNLSLDSKEAKQNDKNFDAIPKRRENLFSFKFFLYSYLFIFMIKFYAMVGGTENTLFSRYDAGWFMNYVNVWAAFFVVTLFSFLIIIIYRIFMYHFDTKKTFFTLKIVDKFLIFTSVNNFLFLMLMLFNDYLVNIEQPTKYRMAINALITNTFISFWILFSFTLAVFLFFAFFNSLVPKRFSKVRSAIMFSNLALIIFLCSIINVGIANNFEFDSFSPNSNIRTIYSPSFYITNNFDIIKNNVLYTYQGGSSAEKPISLGYVNLNEINLSNSFRDIGSFDRVCGIYSTKDFFLVTYSSIKDDDLNHKSNCNKMRILSKDGGEFKNGDINIDKHKMVGVSKIDNVFATFNEKNNFTEIYSISSNKSINLVVLKNVSLGANKSIVGLSKCCYIVSIKGKSSNKQTNYIDSKLVVINNNMSVDLKYPVINGSIFNIGKNNESIIKLITVVKNNFNKNVPIMYFVNLNSRRVRESLIINKEVYEPFFSANSSLFVLNDGTIIYFDNVKNIKKIVKGNFGFINKMRADNNNVIYLKDIGVKLIYPLRELEFLHLK